ncbi:hypothetical protein BCR44DRAFT_36822 [Catenaria anguillulae PL171]|uniref:RING-type domain-containing protein n=1 Tax=Catenaria anguillulae PL171 TaxID=765915 RepID=A0A1Y2HZV0_9FUNG|nr:hypothetical protein BCR44DRAFT_36822 [Catenaria anguillulae PL171]
MSAAPVPIVGGNAGTGSNSNAPPAPIVDGTSELDYAAAGLEPLTPEEQEYLRKHAGHEGQHLAMILILITALVLAQVALIEWRRRRPKSYAYISLAGLALVPLALAINAKFTRFLWIYALFVLANSWVVYRATRRPMSSRTPRAVYRWFAAVYQICYFLGIAGYVVVILSLLGISNLVTNGPDAFSFGLLVMFYGLYFGVLSRDFVEVLSDHMAQAIGYYSKDGLPQKYLRENVCAVCGDHTLGDPDGDSPNPTHQLNCGHVFHESCIRGWCITGKKQSCPYCSEKVDLSAFSEHPWDKAQMYYLQVIDMLRYLVVWQPLIFIGVHGLYKVIGLE